MKRVKAFVANKECDTFVSELNKLVWEGESSYSALLPPEMPVIIIVGAPRSGTTLLLQWLNKYGCAAPSNLAARFFEVPLFAGRLQRLLTDPILNYRNELAVQSHADFKSEYGKTEGALSPHEFSFFIRRFFPVQFGEPLSDTELATCDVKGLLAGLRRFAWGMRCPVALKGLLVQYCLKVFAGQKNVVFVYSHRNEVDNVISLLSHRLTVANDSEEWLSVRPREYQWLRELRPVEQVAGQVRFTNQALQEQFRCNADLIWLDACHEAFCADPLDLHRRLSSALEAIGHPPLPVYCGPLSLRAHRYDRTSQEYRAAAAALDRIGSMAPGAR
jgi:hypothetical protein